MDNNFNFHRISTNQVDPTNPINNGSVLFCGEPTLKDFIDYVVSIADAFNMYGSIGIYNQNCKLPWSGDPSIDYRSAFHKIDLSPLKTLFPIKIGRISYYAEFNSVDYVVVLQNQECEVLNELPLLS